MASQSAKANLFSSLKLGPYTLQNRVMMAPLTRCRATAVGGVPTPIMETYYGARGEAGLIVSEATLVTEFGRGFPRTPGIYSSEQAAAWKPIVKAVHAKGGRMFCQLWHQGRAANKAFTPDNALPIGPTSMEWIDGYGNKQPATEVREIATEEIADIVETYKSAARFALEAGFDGVEVHGANGYLPNQFLCDGSNKRTDAYGGSIENRSKFLLEVMKACIDVWGAEKVGVRISPASHWQDIRDSDPIALWTHVGKELAALGPLAYLHVVEPRDTSGMGATTDPTDLQLTAAVFRGLFNGPILSAGGHDFVSGTSYVEEGKADGIVYGRWFISNPDLVNRWRKLGADAPLNKYDRSTFYTTTPDEKGYNDYPVME